MSRPAAVWTPQRDARLRTMVAQGLRAGVIAADLGLSPDAIRSRLVALGLSLRAARIARGRAMYGRRRATAWLDEYGAAT